MLLHISPKHLNLGPFLFALILGCTGSTNRLPRTTPQHYIITGTITKELGKPCNCKLECHSNAGLIKVGQPDPAYGNYSLVLTAQQAKVLRRFHILDADSVTNIFEFDHELLQDSAITLDFKLRALPKPYRIVMGIRSHSPERTYDTIWVDLKGHRVSKAHSDSVWRRVPLRARRRK